MTTNHPENLDPALIRPGRVDVAEYIGHATEYQMREMFSRFYGGSEQRAQAFAEVLAAYKYPLSTAYLQGLFVSNKDQPQKAVTDAEHYLKSCINAVDKK
jgi:mitochondrial chaperone BCS1